jgi:hypothetical protein
MELHSELVTRILRITWASPIVAHVQKNLAVCPYNLLPISKLQGIIMVLDLKLLGNIDKPNNK